MNISISRTLIILFFFVFSNFLAYANPNQLLLNFSDIEKAYLTRFFHAFFLEDDFSYTLFGAKPMSFGGIYKKNPGLLKSVYDLPKTSRNLSLWKSIEVFKKYKKCVNERYSFVFNEDENSLLIYFIDKEEFIKTIDSNIDIFLKEIGEDFTVVNFLREISEEKTSFLDAINYHEGILGILLGYGRHNSMLFQRKADILGRCWAYGEGIREGCAISTASSGFNSIDEELSYLDKKLNSFSEESEYSSLIPVAPLGFAANNNHTETLKLKHKYTSVRKLINETYTASNPIDVILDMIFSAK